MDLGPSGYTGSDILEHISALYRYAMRLTRNSVEAEDLVQETYVRAVKGIDRLREARHLKAWLFSILRNIRLHQLRKLKTSPQLVDMEREGCSIDDLREKCRTPDEILEGQEDVERVRTAIRKLPTAFQEIILLREFEELSYQDIARVLNCPVGTVMSRLGRARRKLRALLTQRPAPNVCETQVPRRECVGRKRELR